MLCYSDSTWHIFDIGCLHARKSHYHWWIVLEYLCNGTTIMDDQHDPYPSSMPKPLPFCSFAGRQRQTCQTLTP